MSSVVWYYSVNGKVSSPISWEELCEAAEKNLLGPDDLVWTKAFGKEWHKASTLEGLFGLVNPSENKNEDSNNVVNVEAIDEIKDLSEENNNLNNADTIVEQEEEYQPYYYYPRTIGICRSFKKAYRWMLKILFSDAFNIFRWIPFAVAFFMASVLSTSFFDNALVSFSTLNYRQKSQIENKLLEANLNPDFFTTGIFSDACKEKFNELYSFSNNFQMPIGNPALSGVPKSKKQLTPTNNQLAQNPQNQIPVSNTMVMSPEEMTERILNIYRSLLVYLGESASYLSTWIKSKGALSLLVPFILMVVLLKIATLWLGSRGRFIAISRCYNNNEPFAITWRSVASPSNRYFRMLTFIELIVLAINITIFLYFLEYLADGYLSKSLTLKGFCIRIFGFFLFSFLIKIIKFYFSNFLALPILLENRRVTLRYAFKGFGFWFIRFGLIYILLSILFYLFFAFILMVVGAGVVQMLLAIPVVGQLIGLPVYLMYQLWVIDVTKQVRPELEDIRPPIDPMQVNR